MSTVQRLLPRENMQSTLALLLTKVGSVLQVLMNLTNRGIVMFPDMFVLHGNVFHDVTGAKEVVIVW